MYNMELYEDHPCSEINKKRLNLILSNKYINIPIFLAGRYIHTI